MESNIIQFDGKTSDGSLVEVKTVNFPTKPARRMTGAALCAKAIRAELKEKFPQIKFKIQSSNFANGNSVHIRWTDGPTDKAVSDIISKYEYGHFDAMNDIYEYDNHVEGLPQAKYVNTNRERSIESARSVASKIEEKYGVKIEIVDKGDHWTFADRNQRVFGEWVDMFFHQFVQQEGL